MDAFSDARADARLLKRGACCALRSSIQTRRSLAYDPTNDEFLEVAAAITAPEEMIAILELISSVVVAIPTDYTRYR
jgi:hypothetical protein